MSKTITTPKKKHDAAEDAKRAKRLMRSYVELYKEKQELDRLAKEKASATVASLEEARIELLEIGNRNKKSFGKDGNWDFEDGYLHKAFRTEIVETKGFKMSEFVKKFPDYVETTFKVVFLKKALLASDTRQPFIDAHIDVMQNEELQVIVKKK